MNIHERVWTEASKTVTVKTKEGKEISFPEGKSLQVEETITTTKQSGIAGWDLKKGMKFEYDGEWYAVGL